MSFLKAAFFNPNSLSFMDYINSDYDSQSAFPVEIINEQDNIVIDEPMIKAVCSKILRDAGIQTGRLGVVLVDNDTIQELNRQFLEHDYATDVISFNLEKTETHLEGELVISGEMAEQRCAEFEWDKESELLLYIVHGTLHLVDYDDQNPEDEQLMRQMEAEYLTALGIDLPKVNQISR